MILFIYGENTYLCKLKLKELVSVATQKGLQAEYFFCAEPTEESGPKIAWQERMRQKTFFGEKKLFIFLHPFASESFQESILQNLSLLKTPGYTVLFYEEGLPDAKNKLFLILKKEAKCYECPILKGVALQKWIQNEARHLGGTISLAAAQQLSWCCGEDFWRLENELKKLIAFKHGGTILKEDISTICGLNTQTTAFQFIDAVAERNFGAAISFFHRKISEGEEPLRLFGVLVAQLRKLLLFQEAIARGKSISQIKAEWKMHPYAFQKTLSQARRFSGSELKKIYRALFAVDLKLKTGNQEPQAIIESFIMDLNKK